MEKNTIQHREFLKGSEWNKWDLHVHSPASFGYKGNWDSFEKQIVNSDCSVIGINDYNSVEGYKSILDRINAPEGALDLGDKVLFPVVEFRMTNSIQNKNTTVCSATHFNFHVIFDNGLDPNDIELFIKGLKCGDKKIGLDYNNKEKLQTKKVDFKEVIKELEGDDTFKGKYLIWLPYDEYGGIDEIDPKADVWIKSDFIKRSHILGSARKKQIDFFLWKSDLKKDGSPKFSQDEFNEWFKVKKPCIKGSDSHNSNDVIGKLKDKKSIPIEKYCWIKADPTFDGLKQVVYEPEERIYIGKKPQVLERVEQNKTKYIEHLEIKNIAGKQAAFGKWFEKVNIDLNPELVAIIGNKGSGKSALTDVIGLLGNSHNAGENHKYLSFLNNNGKRKKFRKKGLSENFEATLFWKDSSKETLPLDANIDSDQIEKVKYLPQNYFESLTNDLDKDDFDLTLKEVIFRHIPEQYRHGTKTFDGLEDYKSQSLNDDLPLLKQELTEVSSKIIQLEERRTAQHSKKISSLLKEKRRELSEHIKNKPEVVKDPSIDADSHQSKIDGAKIPSKLEELRKDSDRLADEILTKQNDLNILTSNREELNRLLNDLQRFKQQITTYKDTNTSLYLKFDLDIERVIDTTFDDGIIKVKISEINQEIGKVEGMLNPKAISDQDSTKSLIIQKKSIDEKISNLLEKTSQATKDYQEYIEKLKVWKNYKEELEGNREDPEKTPRAISYYEFEESYIKTRLVDELKSLREERVSMSLGIFRKKKEVIHLYEEFKVSIDREIKKDSDFQSKIKMDIDVSFKIDKEFKRKFLSFINQSKSGTFHGITGGDIQLSKILEEEDYLDEENVKRLLNTIIRYLEFDQKLEGNGQTKEKDVSDQVNDVSGLYDYLFDLRYLEPNYDLNLDGKSLDELSPGERGALLLVFYLMIDKEDIPLIIDQPEDNLDNKSVFQILTHFIKSAKKRRQIIIVTHNPNLAVGADAEQIIYVDLDKTNNYRFDYTSGSIENREINRRIVDILEGTMPAFDNRKLKYLD